MGLFCRNANVAMQPQPYDNEYYFTPSRNLNESNLQKTGLRGKSLCAVVFCLFVLWIISIATFVCNVMLLVILRMNHRGMESMQFLKSAENQHLLKFTGRHIHLDTVIPRSGLIHNAGKSKFELESSSLKLVDKKSGTGNVSSTISLENDRVLISNVENFFVADPQTSNVIFEALNPHIKLGKSLKGLTAEIIRANTIRAPIDQDLVIEAEKVFFRGNEGNYFFGKSVLIKAGKDVFVRTNFLAELVDFGKFAIFKEAGKMNLTAKKSIKLPRSDKLRLSSSPDIGANILAKRLCACEITGKIFTVEGNEPCSINPAYCY